MSKYKIKSFNKSVDASGYSCILRDNQIIGVFDDAVFDPSEIENIRQLLNSSASLTKAEDRVKSLVKVKDAVVKLINNANGHYMNAEDLHCLQGAIEGDSDHLAKAIKHALKEQGEE